MQFEVFELERNQSLFENKVDYNLSESGVHPLKLSEVLTKEEQEQILNTELFYGYTNGTPALRNMIAKMYGGSIGPDNVLITSGSAEANFLAVMSQLEPGDEMIYMLPNYPQLLGLARSFGIKVKELYLHQDLGWQLDIGELRALVTSKTKMIAICNPNNPTGSIMKDHIMDEVINICEESDCLLLSDEVYRGAELDGKECRSFAGATKKTVVNAGLSKAYSLPGLRIGWAVASEDYIKRAWSFHDYTVINVAYLSDWVATRIMEYDRRMKILNRTKDHLNNNLNMLESWSKNIPQLTLSRPDAAAISFVKLNNELKSQDFVYRLRDEFSVLLTAGTWHGLEGYVRIGYGTPTEYVREALQRIENFLQSLN